MSKDNVSKLRLSPSLLLPTYQKFAAVNGSSFTANATVNLPVSVQDRSISCCFHVVDKISGYDVILGRDFLSNGFALQFSGPITHLVDLSLPVATVLPNPLVVSSSPTSTTCKHPQDPETPETSDHRQPPNLIPPASHFTSLQKLQTAYEDAFAKNANDVGRTHLASHHIATDGRPVQTSSYKLPYHLLEAARLDISSMLEHGIIEKSDSPYCSPILFVPKPDGGRRLCVDFRRLNAQTRKDSYPMPSIEESLNRLAGCKVFSTLDLVSGFWQIPLVPADKQKTAFRFEGELYQFTVMPFGVSNGPASFQRLMNKVLEECHEFATAYLDDIVIFSPMRKPTFFISERSYNQS